jgi:hypothetical protein
VTKAVKQSPENASYAGLRGLVALRRGQALLPGGPSRREAAGKALREGRGELLRLRVRAELTREQRE